MKRTELLFNIASIPADIISLLIAGLVSFYLRLRLAPKIPIVFSLSFDLYLKFILVAVPVLIIIFALAGLYNLKATRKFSSEFSRIITAVSIALLLVIITFFFNRSVYPSRLIVLSAWGLSILFVVIGRYILRKIQVFFLNRGLGLHNLVIINGLGTQVSLIDEIKNNKELGYKVVAILENSPQLINQLEKLYASEDKIEEILQANPNLSQQTNLSLVQFARNRGLTFNFVPNLFDVQRNAIEIETVQGIPYISLKNTPLEGWGKVVKRIFDIILALICFILTLPLFIVIAILIKIDSPGKILYTAPRFGTKKEFSFYKFRSMYTHMSVGDGYGGGEAEQLRRELAKQSIRLGPITKFKDDPRVTRIGRFLRRTKLDEIPQFLNVLKGDMSMVGPRAHVMDEVQSYRHEYRRIFTIKPGVFGLAQVAQFSWPALPFEEEMRLNTYYVDNWSVWLDMTVLAKSFYYLFFVRKSGDF
jgi:exopolysaccharide biosynthesis polyprenyl glycosylphosphotransferase